MLPQKQAEEAIVLEHEAGGKDEVENKDEEQSMFNMKSFLWHGGSAWDAWFSCASNQVCNFFFIFSLQQTLYLFKPTN